MAEPEKDRIELKPHHWGVSVPDLDAAIEWYRDMLDFSFEHRGFIEAAQANVALLKHGDFSLELFEVKGAKPLPEERRFHNQDLTTHGNKHMAFGVADVPHAVEILQKRGADIDSEGRPTFIRDNSGNLIELMQL